MKELPRPIPPCAFAAAISFFGRIVWSRGVKHPSIWLLGSMLSAGVARGQSGSEPPPIPTAPTSPPPAPTAPPPAPSAGAPAPHATLDYSAGAFYLRSVDDNLVLVPGARIQIDTYTFAGSGVADYQRANGTGLKTNMFFRRFVIELGGMVRRRWFFWFGGNFGPTTIDAVQNPISVANVYDGFIGYVVSPHFRVYGGEYNEPFTMENVTSSRWLDFMERALLIRTVATPYNKSIGLLGWGETPDNMFEYQVGVFGGDGMNRPNIDNRVDGTTRLLLRPVPHESGALKRFHIGGSIRYGSRDPNFVRYDVATMSTPGGYAYWSPNYGSGVDEVHILPSRGQLDIGAEFYVPFERFDIRGEGLYTDEGRREAPVGDRGLTLRSGSLHGVSGYLQVSYWPFGTPRINGNPAGVYGIIRLPKDLGAQDDYGVQVAARAELIRLNYDSNDRSGADRGALAASTTNIDVDAFQVVVNYWATKHIRLTAEYSLYYFPGTLGVTNQAGAPGARKNALNLDANGLHEISFRLGLAL